MSRKIYKCLLNNIKKLNNCTIIHTSNNNVKRKFMSLKKIAGIAAILSSTLFALQASAQEAPLLKKAPPTWLNNWGFSLQLGQLNLDPVAARYESLNDTATLLSLDAERYWNDYNLSIATGFDIQIYRDKAGFRQNTTMGMQSSSASGGSFHFQGGPQMRLGDNDAIRAFLHAGYNQVLSNNRGIGNCTNCYSEKIRLESGNYLAAGIGYKINQLTWGVQYVKYASGDFKDSIALRMTGTF